MITGNFDASCYPVLIMSLNYFLKGKTVSYISLGNCKEMHGTMNQHPCYHYYQKHRPGTHSSV